MSMNSHLEYYVLFIKDLNKIFSQKDTGIVMRNTLYSVWLHYITQAISKIDQHVLNVLKQKKQYESDDIIKTDAVLQIEPSDSKNISMVEIQHLPNTKVAESLK